MTKFVGSRISISNDIVVTARVHYLPQESAPENLRWVFAYHITIRNEGDIPLQLISRHWEITTGVNDEVEIVDGDGVVGEQPRLNPGESYEYTSGAVLEASFGSMEGHYNFRDDQGQWYRVPIKPFILSMPDATMH